MHHFKAKGGTVFNFNSDLSGDVRIRVADHDGPYAPVAEIPAADLLEFVDWWRATYRPEFDDPALNAAAALAREARRRNR